MVRKGLSLAVWIALSGAPVLLADHLQVTAGIDGPANGLCAVNCTNSPNFLTQNDVGLYLTGSKSVTQELLVLLIPDDATNLFATDPIASVKVYNNDYGSLTAAGATGTAEFATAANSKSIFELGEGTQHYVAGGFWGTVQSDKASVKIGKLLGIDLKDSVNMQTVTEASRLFSQSNTDEFGIYTFLIDGAFHGGQLLDLQFSSPLPEGAYIAALTDTGLSTAKSSSGVIDSTIPEPFSVLLLATVALGLGVRGRFAAKG